MLCSVCILVQQDLILFFGFAGHTPMLLSSGTLSDDSHDFVVLVILYDVQDL